jgi:nucleotide-binding universal stress UspA family protein
MALTDILVTIDHHASSAARLAVGVGFARRHQARLSGLLVIRHGYPAESAVRTARDLFERQVAGAGIESRWQQVDGSRVDARMTDIISYHAQFSDLLIVGQGSPASANVGVPADLPEGLVLGTGRPVLVVPYAGTFASAGERVLVAWKAGRESARALNDALPILQQAERVEILIKDRPDAYPNDGETLRADLCEHLARHGVAATANHVLAGTTPLGDVLLNRVCDEGFDLLVLGAHAHGQEGRMAFGAVARQLLREMTVPILLSN